MEKRPPPEYYGQFALNNHFGRRDAAYLIIWKSAQTNPCFGQLDLISELCRAARLALFNYM